jgi:hypothetical protein
MGFYGKERGEKEKEGENGKGNGNGEGGTKKVGEWKGEVE